MAWLGARKGERFFAPTWLGDWPFDWPFDWLRTGSGQTQGRLRTGSGQRGVDGWED